MPGGSRMKHKSISQIRITCTDQKSESKIRIMDLGRKSESENHVTEAPITPLTCVLEEEDKIGNRWIMAEIDGILHYYPEEDINAKPRIFNGTFDTEWGVNDREIVSRDPQALYRTFNIRGN